MHTGESPLRGYTKGTLFGKRNTTGSGAIMDTVVEKSKVPRLTLQPGNHMRVGRDLFMTGITMLQWPPLGCSQNHVMMSLGI